MKAFTAWFTGLPCSGKTTLVNLLYRELLRRGVVNVEVLDGCGSYPLVKGTKFLEG